MRPERIGAMPRSHPLRDCRVGWVIGLAVLLIVPPIALSPPSATPATDFGSARSRGPGTVPLGPASAPAPTSSSSASWIRQDPQPSWGPTELWAYDSEIGCPVLQHQSGPGSTETWSRCTGSWQLLTTRGTPTPAGLFLVDDARDGYLLYGGDDLLNNTWTFSGGTWTHLALSTAPSPRTGESVAYSAALGEVILFGGSTGAQSLQDTWAFSAGTWTLLTPSVSPWARFGAALADDSSDGYLVLFGGVVTRSGVTAAANDTWRFTAAGWTELAPSTAPAAGSLSTVGYLVNDPAGAGALYVGPCAYTYYATGFTCENATGFSNGSTWRFANGSWSNLSGVWFVGALDAPPTYDTARGAVEAVGSATGQTTTYPDLFTFGTAWTVTPALPAPPGGAYGGSTPVMAYDPALSEIVLLAWNGTYYDPGTLEQWTFNASGWSPSPSPTPIPGRQGEGLAFDSFDGELLVYGGTDGVGHARGDAWVLTAAGWAQVVQAVGGAWPPLASATFLADDPSDHCVLLFENTGNPASETWTFAGGRWTARSATLGPPSLFQPTLAADSSGGFDLLYGGLSQPVTDQGPPYVGVLAPLLWGFENLTWANLTGSLPSLPPYWAGATLTDDPSVAGMLLFGGAYEELSASGRPIGYASMNATWIFNGTGWSNQTSVVGAPMSGRIVSLMAYDSSLASVILFSGTPDSWAFNPSDTWRLPSNPSTGPLGLTSFGAYPPAIDVGMGTTFWAAVTNVRGAVGYRYSGLPPGCASANGSWILCTPAAPGVSNVSVGAVDATGVGASASTVLRVAPTLSVQLTAAPASVTLGNPLRITVAIVGGTRPFAVTFSGLPAGCAPGATGNVSCTPTAIGSSVIQVQVRDAVDSAANASATVTVRSGTNSLLFEAAALGGIGVAAVAVVAVWRGRRLRRRPPSAPPLAPATATEHPL